ncbi:MAG TPA: carbonic anhydrase [Pirellulales bacterium]|jgi:carbonic anhydrase|nr:carbonic anhydrase [Pirellulales bacterium]
MSKKMIKLIHGIVEFRETRLPKYAEHFRHLAEGQCPDALFITCSDSRVVPELLASTDPGELFVNRNVGNMIPPATAEGNSTGDLSEAAGIEFAVNVLGVENIVICGHSECGAMRAALDPSAVPKGSNLGKWLHHCASAVFRLEQEGPLDRSLSVHNQLSQVNVLVQLEHLMTYPIVKEKVLAKKIRICGWWFEIRSGEMHAYNKEARKFEPIDRDASVRIIERIAAGR